MPKRNRARARHAGIPRRDQISRPRLVAYLQDAPAVRHLERILSNSYTITLCESLDAIKRTLTDAQFDALILDRVDSSGASTIDAVRLVGRFFPSVAIIMYCTPGPALFHEIIEFSRAGVHELVLRGADDLRGTLQRTIIIAAEAALARHALSMLEPRLSPQVADIVRTCLAHANGRLNVDSLARALGVTRKTLAIWTAASGAPAPGLLIGWSRVAMAARLLEDPGRSVEVVAHTTHFGSASALNNMFRRYLGQSPSVVRTNGGVNVVLKKWFEAFKAQ